MLGMNKCLMWNIDWWHRWASNRWQILIAARDEQILYVEYWMMLECCLMLGWISTWCGIFNDVCASKSLIWNTDGCWGEQMFDVEYWLMLGMQKYFMGDVEYWLMLGMNKYMMWNIDWCWGWTNVWCGIFIDARGGQVFDTEYWFML